MKTIQSLKFIRSAADVADEKKGEDILALDVREVSSLTDCFLFVAATSYIHVKTIEDAVRIKMKEMGADLKRTDGSRGHPWRVLDYGDFMVHVMEKNVRDFYSVERLWNQGKKITLKAKAKPKSKTKKKAKKKKTKRIKKK